MENCVIYSHQLAFDKVVQLVKTHLPKAQLQQRDDGLNKSLIATIKGGLFGRDRTLTLNYRQRLNPSYTLTEIECPLTQNLSGFVNYLKTWPAHNNDIKNQLIYKVMATNSEMSFMADPDINSEMQQLLRYIAKEVDAFIFAQPSKLFIKSKSQYIADPDLKLILDSNGNSEVDKLSVSVDARYHDTPEAEITSTQLERKQRSEDFLRQHNVKINANLPCVESDDAVVLRTVNDVIERAYALLVVAAKGEGVEQQHLERAIKEKNIKSFSPEEQRIVDSASLTDQERAYATWRYESLTVMLWALGVLHALPYPSAICNVSEVVSLIFKPSYQEFANSVHMRSVSDILDELDKTYRIHWACVDARLKGLTIADVEPGVVYERHYALNWLTSSLNQDWDDVQTNT